MKNIAKTLALAAMPSMLVLLALTVTKPKEALAQTKPYASANPAMTSFRYKTPSGADMESMSWENNGVRCTMTRPYTMYSAEHGLALSCVKM